MILGFFTQPDNTRRMGIDETGLISLGNSVPIARLTVNGVSFFNSSGSIINQQIISSTLSPSVGSVSITYDSYAPANEPGLALITCPSVLGRQPVVNVWSPFGPIVAYYESSTGQIVRAGFSPRAQSGGTYTDAPAPVCQVALFSLGLNATTNVGFFYMKNNSEGQNTQNAVDGRVTSTYTGNYIWI